MSPARPLNEEEVSDMATKWKNAFNTLQLDIPKQHEKASVVRKVKHVKTGAKHKLAGQRTSDPSTITPAERILQFPNQCFELSPASAHDFFCRCCIKTMSTKNSTIKEHITSGTHIKNLANVALEGTKKVA